MKYKTKCNILDFINHKIVLNVLLNYYKLILYFFKNENIKYKHAIEFLKTKNLKNSYNKYIAILFLKKLIYGEELKYDKNCL